MKSVFFACAALLLISVVEGQHHTSLHHSSHGYHGVGVYNKNPHKGFSLLIFGLIAFLLGYVIEIRRCNNCARKDANVNICTGSCERVINLDAIPVCTCKELF